MSETGLVGLIYLQLMMEQAVPSNDIIRFIEKQWPQDIGLIIHKAASAYNLASELMGNPELKGFDARFPPSPGEVNFRFWALLGKAIVGDLPTAN